MHELLPWLRLIGGRRSRLLTGALLLFLTLATGMGLLALSGWFIAATGAAGLALSLGSRITLDVYVPGGGIRALALTRTVARYAERLYNHDTVLRLLADIRVRIFRDLAARRTGGRRHLAGARWLSRLTADVDALDTLYLRVVAPPALAVLAAILLVGAAGLFIDPTLALVIGLVLTAAFIAGTLLVYRQTEELAHRRVVQLESLRVRLIEQVEGQAELTAAGLSSERLEETLRQADGLCDEQARIERKTGWSQALVTLLINLAVLASVVMGYQLVRAGAVPGPVMAVVPLALLGLLEAFSILPDAFSRLGGTRAAAQRLNRDTTPGRNIKASPPVSPAAGPVSLELDRVSVRYGAAPPLPDAFSLVVSPGQTVGLTGPSGSGKSTLGDVIAGLVTPSSGHCALTPPAPVCYLTQATRLFDDTVRNNLALAHPEVSDAALWEVLEAVDLAARFDTSAGLGEWLGAGGTRLSGGEARRLALARVLLSQAPVIVLDEPFTGLDPATRDRIRPRLASWLEGRTVLALAHHPEALPLCDRVISLP